MEGPRIQWLFSPQGWVSACLVFSIYQHPKEVGSNAHEGTDLLVKARAAGKERTLPSLVSFM